MVRHAAAFLAALLLGVAPLQAQDIITFTVAGPSADVHKAPSTASPVIGHAPGGRAFEVRRNLGSWVRVDWPAGDGGFGYLHVTWGTLSNGAPKTAASQMPAGRPSPAAPRRLAPPADPIGRSSVPQPRNSIVLPSHVLGVGGRLSAGPLGFSATGRGWNRRGLGAQLEIGMNHRTSGFDFATGTERLRTLELSPSVLYSPRNVATDAIWARPYFGGGVMMSRSTRSNLPAGVGAAPALSHNGLGYQIFGGTELTWSALPALAVSADLRRQWAPVPFADSLDGRFAFSASVHWYVK